MLTAISPIDGRYSRQTAPLSAYFSEYALIRYRILVEVRYFNALCRLPLPQLKEVPPEKLTALLRVAEGFDVAEAEAVKHIERETNHDVKAVEYYLKSKMDGLGLERYKEFIHFGLTSQDINNTATPLLLKHAMEQVYYPTLTQLLHSLEALAEAWRGIPMLAHTHGQPASPTTVGKEFRVFTERLNAQTVLLHGVAYKAKFGGATGNFNAHHVAYPDVDWRAFADYFVEKDLGLTRSHPTTQIEHYDHLAALFHGMMRINTILIDLCRDVWTYISMEYFKQKTVAGEIGSSAMPHKVNPIDFENAEGNLGLANVIFGHLADKLPVSRLQRDLTDSTVLRNIGVPFAHTMIAFQAIAKGLGKLILNESKLGEDLDANWAVVAEAIQTILRREGYPQPYEALKELTRGKTAITQADIKGFIGHLKVSSTVKDELSKITPHNFVGLID
ncbi:MAG: adenylosuccinate lyase [Saprospiraceae bacterium]|nr:adenylosuccinate lyase [Saprospiraceae bacterium]